MTGGSAEGLKFNFSGVLFGLAAGLSYATMNILGKALVNKYKQLTILTYTFGLAFIFSLTFFNPLVLLKMEFDIFVWLNILLLGIVPTAISYSLFTTGLSYGIESSKASIIATIEVPISVIISYFFFGQEVLGWKLVGITMILISVVLLQGMFLMRIRILSNKRRIN